MSQDTVDQAKRIIIGEYTEWIKRFDVNDYVKNQPMIEKLNEEKQLALVTSFQLEKKVKSLESIIHQLELQNQQLEFRVDEANRKSLLTFILSLLAAVLAGIGANLATSTPYGWTGWIMIVTACLLEATAFLSRPKEDK